MDLLTAVPGAIDYIRKNPSEVWRYVEAHLQLSFTAILIAAAVSLPLGVLASRNRHVSLYATNVVGVFRAIPSVAILFLAYPYLNVGYRPALLALTLLAFPPILINTSVGFAGVDPSIREAAYGMGMSTLQVLYRVELPLALPVVIAGLRTATVEVIASATLATFVGADSLGLYINEGLQTFQTSLMLVGAVPVALMTLLAEVTLGGLERLTRRASGLSMALA